MLISWWPWRGGLAQRCQKTVPTRQGATGDGSSDVPWQEHLDVPLAAPGTSSQDPERAQRRLPQEKGGCVTLAGEEQGSSCLHQDPDFQELI